MRKTLLAWAILFFFPIFSMKKRPNEEIAEQKLDEPKVARTELVQEHIDLVPPQAPPGELSNEMGAEFLKCIAKAPAVGGTFEQKLYNAIASIRNFMNAFPQFYGDEKINGELIKELAQRYTPGNQIKVATALATTGAGQWMAKFIENNIQEKVFLAAQFVNAAENGDVGRLRFIITFVPQIINQGDNRDAATALIVAAQNGHTEVVKQLLQVPGINVNMQNQQGFTALMMAAYYGRIAIVNQLLQAPGVNVNMQTRQGTSALMFASDNGHTAILERLLVVPGINVNMQNARAETALMMAASRGHATAVERLLQAPGINVNLHTREGSTALMSAAYKGHLAIVKWLLQVPAINVNSRSSTGTALRFAQQANSSNKDAIIKLLIEHGATE